MCLMNDIRTHSSQCFLLFPCVLTYGLHLRQLAILVSNAPKLNLFKSLAKVAPPYLGSLETLLKAHMRILQVIPFLQFPFCFCMRNPQTADLCKLNTSLGFAVVPVFLCPPCIIWRCLLENRFMQPLLFSEPMAMGVANSVSHSSRCELAASHPSLGLSICRLWRSIILPPPIIPIDMGDLAPLACWGLNLCCYATLMCQRAELVWAGSWEEVAHCVEAGSSVTTVDRRRVPSHGWIVHLVCTWSSSVTFSVKSLILHVEILCPLYPDPGSSTQIIAEFDSWFWSSQIAESHRP